MALQDDINNFGAANTAADLLVLAACTANTTSDRIVKINSDNELPDLATNTVSTGTILFHDTRKIPVIANEGKWVGIDGKVLRTDTATVKTVAFAWGFNTCGGVGDGTVIARSSPVTVAGGITDWKTINPGQQCYGSGLKENGKIYTWGNSLINRNIGVGNASTSLSPVVLPGDIDWTKIDIAREGVLGGIDSSGDLYVWGFFNPFMLPSSNECVCSCIQITCPEKIDDSGDWVDFSISQRAIGAIKSDGTLWTWGAGSGELGRNLGQTNPLTGFRSPGLVCGGFTDWCGISFSCSHMVGIRANGTLWSWGFNNGGQLGDNTTTCRSSPVSVVGGFTDWCQAVTGNRHVVALRTNGTLWSWGYNNYGQVGNNTVANRSSPVSVVGGFTDWCNVSAGYGTSGGIRTNGTLWTWGTNSGGQLGDDTTVCRSSPVSVVTPANTIWRSVSLGASTSGAIGFLSV